MDGGPAGMEWEFWPGGAGGFSYHFSLATGAGACLPSGEGGQACPRPGKGVRARGGPPRAHGEAFATGRDKSCRRQPGGEAGGVLLARPVAWAAGVSFRGLALAGWIYGLAGMVAAERCVRGILVLPRMLCARSITAPPLGRACGRCRGGPEGDASGVTMGGPVDLLSVTDLRGQCG